MDFDIKQLVELANSAAGVRVVELPTLDGITPIGVASPREQGRVSIEDAKKIYDNWRTAPERIEGVAEVTEVQSFVDLVNRHKNSESAIFSDFRGRSVLAVIDYHEATTIAADAKPHFCRHRVHMGYRFSVEWSAWASKNTILQEQEAFAQFVEDRIADMVTVPKDIGDPIEATYGLRFGTPAEILTVSRGLELSVSMNVKEVVNLQNGVAQIQFEEEHDAKDKNGQKITVPGLFALSIPIFDGGEKDTVIFRLRYKRAGGRLKWAIYLLNAEKLVKERLTADFAWIAEQTKLPVYAGMPEAIDG